MTPAERRWRLILGRLSERALGDAPLPARDAAMQSALDFLYSRAYDKRGIKLQPGSRGAGSSPGVPTVLDWLKQLPTLFPEDVCETIQQDALERFEMQEILTDPDALQRMEPNQQLLESLLMLKGKMNEAVLTQLRRIIRRVVEEITERLRREVEASFSGRRNPHRRSHLKLARNFDWQRTIRANLRHFDAERRQLVVNRLYFNSRVKQRLPWRVVLCVDQSGSMASSVIYAAVMGSILSQLPAVDVRLVVFDTQVVDLSGQAQDPVELLMSVQLGGGTDIGRAVHYCEGLIDNPQRTIFALISDFYEGAYEQRLLAAVKRLVESRVTAIGLAALDDTGTPDYDRRLAQRLARVGMHVGVMTPQRFAHWLAGVMEAR
ncbi:MAG: VWA domain-containing protein [Candidatus Thiodiazotropha sp.]